jgi:hypothetical protein
MMEGDRLRDARPGAVSFRSFSKMSARQRDAAISAGSLGSQLSNYVEQRFNLPLPICLILVTRLTLRSLLTGPAVPLFVVLTLRPRLAPAADRLAGSPAKSHRVHYRPLPVDRAAD